MKKLLCEWLPNHPSCLIIFLTMGHPSGFQNALWEFWCRKAK